MQATDLVIALRRQERLFQRPGVLLHAFLALFESPAGLQARHLSPHHPLQRGGGKRGKATQQEGARAHCQRRRRGTPWLMPSDAMQPIREGACLSVSSFLCPRSSNFTPMCEGECALCRVCRRAIRATCPKCLKRHERECVVYWYSIQ